MRNAISLLGSSFFILFLTCTAYAQSNEDSARPTVVSTIWPLHLIASEILGNEGTATVLIDSNDSAHHFNLTPADRIAISGADVLLWIDPVFETQLGTVFESVSENKAVITAAELPDIHTREFADQSLDPHLWLDPDNAATIARALAQRLARVDPNHEATYLERASVLAESLTQLQSKLDELANTGIENFFVYHDAFSYMEAKLKIRHVAEFVVDPDAEPSMRHLLRLRQQAAETNSSCVLAEPDFSKELVDAVFPDGQANLVVVDVLGHDTSPGAGAYAGFLSRLLDGFGACIAPEL